MGYLKEVFKNTLYKFTNLDASNVLSFDCGSFLSMILNSPSEQIVSIIPDREEPSGLTHAYK